MVMVQGDAVAGERQVMSCGNVDPEAGHNGPSAGDGDDKCKVPSARWAEQAGCQDPEPDAEEAR